MLVIFLYEISTLAVLAAGITPNMYLVLYKELLRICMMIIYDFFIIDHEL